MFISILCDKITLFLTESTYLAFRKIEVRDGTPFDDSFLFVQKVPNSLWQKLVSSAFALLFTEISVVWVTEISVVRLQKFL